MLHDKAAGHQEMVCKDDAQMEGFLNPYSPGGVQVPAMR